MFSKQNTITSSKNQHPREGHLYYLKSGGSNSKWSKTSSGNSDQNLSKPSTKTFKSTLLQKTIQNKDANFGGLADVAKRVTAHFPMGASGLQSSVEIGKTRLEPKQVIKVDLFNDNDSMPNLN